MVAVNVRLGAVEAARTVLEASERGATIVVALVLDGPAEGARRLRVLEPGDGEPTRDSRGSLGSEALNRAADRALDEALDRPRLSPRASEAGTVRIRTEGSDGEVRLFLERTRPAPGLLIVGAGHLAVPLHAQGHLLGFRVTVVDDRPEFAEPVRFPRADRVARIDFSDPFATILPAHRTHVVLVTRGHRYDFECLRRLLTDPRPTRYIGMIGSRRRVRATFHQLLEDGIPRERLDAIRAPVGLDLGAETPEEIAVAVAAEWVVLGRGGSGRPLVEIERIAERHFAGGNDD